MRKTSLMLIIIGTFLILFGGYSYFNLDNSVNDETIFVPAITEDDKNKIIRYLKLKYGEDFSIVEHVTRFCIIDKKDYYDIDYSCKTSDIVDDIYLVKNGEDLTFYVKKVTVKDDYDVSSAISNSQNSGYYDNYILFNVIEKLNKELESNFSSSFKLNSIEIISGLGKELPSYKKENGKYIYYVIYDKLNSKLRNVVNKDIDVDEYIDILSKNNISTDIELIVKIDDELNVDNAKKYIKLINDNNFVYLKYGLRADMIIFEFSNKMYIKYSDSLFYEIFEYDKDMFEDSSKAYENKIVKDYTSNESNTIYYDKFMEKELIF